VLHFACLQSGIENAGAACSGADTPVFRFSFGRDRHDSSLRKIAMSEFIPPPAPASSPVVFFGRRSDFRRLVVRGALLELVTVGFYRFWLATDMRRHLWSSTAVEGDAPEYTGSARELLIGFLFALAILAPIYLVYFLLGLEAERLQALASIPLGLFFFLFAQFAIYRARRYRLTRTVWRGVRFWMRGSGVSYAWRAGLWTLLIMLSLGLALPWARAALERFKMRHTSYGDLTGGFDSTGWDFFKRGWWLWLLAWPSAILVIPLPFIYAAFKAIEWRWWISGIRFGEVRFQSDMRGGALIGLYWKVIGWSMLLGLALSIWAGMVLAIAFAVSGGGAATAQKTLLVSQQLPVLIAIGFGYVVTALAFGAVTRVYLIRDVWLQVAASTTVHNLAAADDVVAHGDMVSALGEGFADSLDVVGF
jgi:uncharacterized membrane protein YjgN (DUF898 family)